MKLRDLFASALLLIVIIDVSIAGGSRGELPRKFDILGNLDNLEMEFHGYLRAGIGGSGARGDQECFLTPGARAKYRLGNECEIYNELFFGTTYRPVDGSPLRFTTNLRLAGSVDGHTDWETWDPALREIWVGAKGLGHGRRLQHHYWIGKRFYRREDIHINDFYYWDASGNGAGIEDIDIGSAKVAFAYFRDTSTETGNDDVVHRFDWRAYAIKRRSHTIGLGGDFHVADERTNSITATHGWSLTGTLHSAEWFGGWNKLAVQYGQGLGTNFGRGTTTRQDDDDVFRISDQMLIPRGDNLKIMLVGVYEKRNYEQATEDLDWLSLGMRPVYHFTDHIAVALEAGMDLVEPRSGGTRQLTKITLAPMITSGRGFFDRPQLRAFVTYASWNEAARVAGLEGTGNNTTDDVTYGFQVEHWW